MRILGCVLMGCAVFALTSCGGGNKTSTPVASNTSPKESPKELTTAEKLVGVWEATKGEMPPGSTLEFAKDGKLKMVIKAEGKEMKAAGTYKVEGDLITTTLKEGDMEQTEKHKIKTLTATTLITEESNKKQDEFKKK